MLEPAQNTAKGFSEVGSLEPPSGNRESRAAASAAGEDGLQAANYSNGE